MFCWHFDATISKGSFYIKDSRNSRRRERSWLCNLPDASHRSSRNHFSTVIALVLRFVLSSKYCWTNRNFSKKDTFGKKLINTNIIETCSLSSYLIDFIIHEFVDKFQTILVLPYLKKKEKEKKHVHPRYVKRELITRINKRRKEFAGFDDVPKLNCAKGSGKGGRGWVPNPIFIISTWHPRFPISIKGGAPPCRGFLSVFIIKFLGVESWPSRIPPLFKCFNIRIHVAFDCILMAPIYRPIPLITFIE